MRSFYKKFARPFVYLYRRDGAFSHFGQGAKPECDLRNALIKSIQSNREDSCSIGPIEFHEHVRMGGVVPQIAERLLLLHSKLIPTSLESKTEASKQRPALRPVLLLKKFSIQHDRQRNSTRSKYGIAPRGCNSTVSRLFTWVHEGHGRAADETGELGLGQGLNGYSEVLAART